MADDAPVRIPDPPQTAEDDHLTRKRINEAILLNHRRPKGRRKTIRALASELSVPPNYIYEQRHKLRKRGLLPDFKPRHGLPPIEQSQTDNSSENATSESVPASSISVILQMVEKIEVPDATQRRKILAFIIENGTDQHKIAALSKLEEMDSSLGSGVGPQLPLSGLDRIDRMARLLVMMGRREALSAFKQAFPDAKPLKEAQNATETPQNPSQAGESDARSDGTVD